MRVVGYSLIVLSGVILFAVGVAAHHDPKDFPAAELTGFGVIIFGCALVWFEARRAGLLVLPSKEPPRPGETPAEQPNATADRPRD